MQNPMQVAEKRIKEYRMAISKKENEIVELKERLEDLDNFMEFGQALVGMDGAPQAQPEKPKQQEAEAAKPTTPTAEEKADDDWSTDDEASPINNGITRVLSQRTG